MEATASTVALPSTGTASLRNASVATCMPFLRPVRIAIGFAPAAMLRMPSAKIA